MGVREQLGDDILDKCVNKLLHAEIVTQTWHIRQLLRAADCRLIDAETAMRIRRRLDMIQNNQVDRNLLQGTRASGSTLNSL
jgi:hypothetical protein